MTKKRKLYVSIICAVLALLMISPIIVSIFGAVKAGAVTQAEIDALKTQKSEVSSQKDAIQTEIDTLVSEQSTLTEQKEALDLQVTLTLQEIEIINEQIDLYAAVIEAKAADLEEAISVETTQKDRLRTRMRAMEENGTANYLSCIFQATSFSDLLTRMNEISLVLEHDKALEDDYVAARENVEEVKAEFEEAKAEEEASRIELEEKKAELEEDIAAAAALLAALAEEIQASKEAYAAAAAAEQAFMTEIANMIAELERQEAEAKKLAESNGGSYVGNPQSTGIYQWPLPGYTPGSAYGWRLHPIFNDMRFHAGEDVGAATGTPILAADGGTVATATYSSSYGNYVMINHGGGRVTLYAHMSSMAVSVGQSVSKGQVIGYVGSTGWSTGPHLHFEVRVNGATTDPKQYFGGVYY